MKPAEIFLRSGAECEHIAKFARGSQSKGHGPEWPSDGFGMANCLNAKSQLGTAEPRSDGARR
jgi:hypothetical protein